MRERKIVFASLRFQRRMKEEVDVREKERGERREALMGFKERERERERRCRVCVYVWEGEILNVKLTTVLLKLLMHLGLMIKTSGRHKLKLYKKKKIACVLHMTALCVSLFFFFFFFFLLTPVLVCSNCCNLVCRKSLSNDYYYAHGKEGMGHVEVSLSKNVKS